MITKTVRSVYFQILAPGEGDGVILEFLDEGTEEEFMEINIDPAGVRHVVLYPTSEAISMSLEDLKKGIAIAEARVHNFPQEEFGEEPED